MKHAKEQRKKSKPYTRALAAKQRIENIKKVAEGNQKAEAARKLE